MGAKYPILKYPSSFLQKFFKNLQNFSFPIFMLCDVEVEDVT